ncbi:MAG: DUF4153 domain-containing protein [Candidatus Paceibacterota bacterium]
MFKLFHNFDLGYFKAVLFRMFERFPVSVFISLVAFLLMVGFIRLGDELTDLQEAIVLKVLISLGLSFVFSVAIYLLGERRNYRWHRRNYLQAITLIFGLLFYYFFEEELFIGGQNEVVVYIILTALGIVAFLFVARFWRKFRAVPDSQETFYSQSYTLVLKILMTAVAAGSAMALGSIGLATLFTLFDITFLEEGHWFGYWAAFTGVLFAPFFFLANLPEEKEWFGIKSDMIAGNKFFAFLIKSIGVPAIFIYFIILYAYTGKVLINFSEWPQGEVSWMVILFSFFGFLIYFASYIYRDTSKLTGIFRKILPVAVLLQTPMLFYAIGLRIDQYDITINRYLVVVFGLWLLFLSCYYLISKKKDLSTPFYSLLVVVLIMSIGPWSVYDLTETRQIKELRNNMVEAGILADGEITPLESYDAIDARLSGKIYGGIEYLCDFHGCDTLESIFTDKLEELRQADRQEFEERKEEKLEDLEAGDASAEDILRVEEQQYTGMSKWEMIRELTEYLKVEQWTGSQNIRREPKYLNFENALGSDVGKSIDIDGYEHYVSLHSSEEGWDRYIDLQKEEGRSVEGVWSAFVDNQGSELKIYKGEQSVESLDISESVVQKIMDNRENYTDPDGDRFLTGVIPEEDMTFDLNGESYEIRLVLRSIAIPNPDRSEEEEEVTESPDEPMPTLRKESGSLEGYILLKAK